MTTPLPPEREGSTRQRRAGEGLSPDKAYDRAPTDRSRLMRSNPTPAERLLWKHLANKQLLGVRFNRQVSVRPYICDFVARSVKLVIELDGGQHAAQVDYDETRTSFLKSRGYRVIRFWNNDVLSNIDGVVRTIEQALADRPSPGPSRSGGRGENS